MKYCNVFIALGALSLGLAQAQEPTAQSIQSDAETAAQPATDKVMMHTELGDITLLIETERAPITAANFLRYVDAKCLDGVGFYRAVKIGDNGEYGLAQFGLQGNTRKVFKPIEHEATSVTGLSHVDGAISMARLAPGTATADFFIVMGNLTTMDAQPNDTSPGDHMGYAVFGRVIKGMEVVKQILAQPRSLTAGEGIMKGQMLEPPVKVLTVRRVQ